MRTVARLLTCLALAATVAACVPIGVKGTTLPYAAIDSAAMVTSAR